jgi:hypothetical protein
MSRRDGTKVLFASVSIMLPSPLPESNYYVVFTKANSPSDTYASKTKLRPLSGTLSSLHRSILLQEPYSAHRKYLHQSRLTNRHQEEGGWVQIPVRLWSDPHYKSQYFGRKDTKSGEKGTVTEKAKNRRNLLKGLALPGKIWRRGSESNRRIKVLQTSPLPLGYRAPGQRKPTGNPTSGGVKITASVFALGMTTGSVLIGAGDGT